MTPIDDISGMPPLDDIVVTVTDIRRAGICMAGARQFFADRGVNIAEVIANGISAQYLWDTGDGYAQKVVKRKLAREGFGG